MTTIDRHPDGALCWADLMTDDPEAARAFYGRLFDWSFDVGGPETGHYAMCKRGGKPVAGLGAKPPGAPFPAAWTPYFSTSDLDRTLAKLTAEGGSIRMGPMDVLQEGRMAVCGEPTGGTFGLWQPGRHIGAQLIDEPGSLAWNELNTRDLERARRFLVALFGYEARRLPGGMTYDTLHLGERTIGGILQMDEHWPAQVPPHWMIYFAVPQIEATTRDIRALGGKVCVPPFETPYGVISVLEDPGGAVFSAVQPPPGR
jgi:predicted enzyme related to lactoylglutathione lyase